jgi:hypothetical protein
MLQPLGFGKTDDYLFSIFWGNGVRMITSLVACVQKQDEGQKCKKMSVVHD